MPEVSMMYIDKDAAVSCSNCPFLIKESANVPLCILAVTCIHKGHKLTAGQIVSGTRVDTIPQSCANGFTVSM